MVEVSELVLTINIVHYYYRLGQASIASLARHNQIANCKNADGISTILSIVCPYMKQGCIQIFFMQKIVEEQQEERWEMFEI